MGTIEETLSRLRSASAHVSELKSVYPLKAPKMEPGCAPAELADLQDFLFRKLPDDYQTFLLACRSISASDVFNGYFFFSPLRVVVMRRDSSVPRILHIPDSSGVLTEAHVVVFAGDGGGNLFLLEIGADTERVWKWCHEYPVRSHQIASEGLSVVGHTFSEFLARVAEDWEHFLEDDRSWSYLSG